MPKRATALRVCGAMTPQDVARHAKSQVEREQNCEKYGHPFGFLHEVPDQRVTDRQVDASIRRYLKEKTDEAKA